MENGFIPRAPRKKVLIRARMLSDGPATEVCIRDISSGGLLLQAFSPPAKGAYVDIMAPGLAVVGRVLWRKNRRFGVQATNSIDVAAVVRTPMAGNAPFDNSKRLVQFGKSPAKAVSTDVWQKAERSRHLSSHFQFAILVASVAILTAMIGGSLYDHFADYPRVIARQLSAR